MLTLFCISTVVYATTVVLHYQVLYYKFKVLEECTKNNLHVPKPVNLQTIKIVNPQTTRDVKLSREQEAKLLKDLLDWMKKNGIKTKAELEAEAELENLNAFSYLEPFNINIENNIKFYINIFFLFLLIIFFFISFFSKNFKNLILDIIRKKYFFIVPIPLTFILFKNLKNFYLLNLYIYYKLFSVWSFKQIKYKIGFGYKRNNL